MRNNTIKSRQRLIDAGVDVFGQYGYEAATTRMIARQAKVNIASIPYYFTGKEGLYQAVVAHVAENVLSFLAPSLQEIETRTATQPPTATEAVTLLEDLLGKMIDFMVGSPEAPRFVRIVLREQLFPSAAYDIIFSQIMAPMINALSQMIAIASGKSPSPDTKLRALSFMGQVMAFRVARETVVRALGMEGYSVEETREIRRIVLEQSNIVIRELARAKPA